MRAIRFALLGALIMPLFSAAALAQNHAQSTSASAWTTASHLGFGVVDRSTTGFNDSAGSLLFLDLARHLSDKVELGLRTVAQGARLGARSYYRLGAGPLISWSITPKWRLQGAVATFHETGMADEDDANYKSRGQSVQIGWQRIIPFGRQVEFLWGGFVMGHQGDLRPAAASQRLSLNARSNVGLGHGVEVGMRVRL